MASQASFPEHPEVFEMSASCTHFSHPDPEFAAWRNRVKVNCGDYEMCLIGVPKHMSDCYKRKRKQENTLFHSPTSKDGKLVGKRVADVLWDHVGFGGLGWHRSRPSRGIGGLRWHSIQGKLTPEAGVAEVLVEKAKIMKQISYFPSTEDDKKQIIEDDCDELVELVIKHGSFAQVVLKEGQEMIVRSYEDPNNGGNSYEAVFETARTRFMIYFVTS